MAGSDIRPAWGSAGTSQVANQLDSRAANRLNSTKQVVSHAGSKHEHGPSTRAALACTAQAPHTRTSGTLACTAHAPHTVREVDPGEQAGVSHGQQAQQAQRAPGVQSQQRHAAPQHQVQPHGCEGGRGREEGQGEGIELEPSAGCIGHENTAELESSALSTLKLPCRKFSAGPAPRTCVVNVCRGCEQLAVFDVHRAAAANQGRHARRCNRVREACQGEPCGKGAERQRTERGCARRSVEDCIVSAPPRASQVCRIGKDKACLAPALKKAPPALCSFHSRAASSAWSIEVSCQPPRSSVAPRSLAALRWAGTLSINQLQAST